MCSWKRTRDSGRERCGVAQAGADLHCLPSGDYTKAKYPSSRRAADRSREAPPRYAGCPASEFDRGALRLLGELGGLLDNVQVEMLLCRVLGINSLFASQFVANRGQIPRSDSQGVLRKSLLLGVKFVSQFRRSARKSRDSLFFIPVNREIGLGDRFDTGCVRHHAFRRQLPYRREPMTTAEAHLAPQWSEPTAAGRPDSGQSKERPKTFTHSLFPTCKELDPRRALVNSSLRSRVGRPGG